MNTYVNRFWNMMTLYMCSGLIKFSPFTFNSLIEVSFPTVFFVPGITMGQKALSMLLKTVLQDWHRFRLTRCACSFDKESSFQKHFSAHCARLLTICHYNPFNVVVLWNLCKGFASYHSKWEYKEQPKIKSPKVCLIS